MCLCVSAHCGALHDNQVGDWDCFDGRDLQLGIICSTGGPRGGEGAVAAGAGVGRHHLAVTVPV